MLRFQNCTGIQVIAFVNSDCMQKILQDIIFSWIHSILSSPGSNSITKFNLIIFTFYEHVLHIAFRAFLIYRTHFNCNLRPRHAKVAVSTMETAFSIQLNPLRTIFYDFRDDRGHWSTDQFGQVNNRKMSLLRPPT